MIPYMVGKHAPNSLHLTRGLVKSVPGRGYFRAVPSQNGDKYVTFPPPPIVELVKQRKQTEVNGQESSQTKKIENTNKVTQTVETN